MPYWVPSMSHERDEVHREDVAWATALAAGDRVALERYERELAPAIAAQARKRGCTDDEVGELQQILRARLFVGDGDGPAIARYEGRSPLRAWILVAAMREAVRMRQRAAREPATDFESLLEIADRDDAVKPAMDKERYRAAFRGAFRTAITELAPRERTILRMHLLDGLTIDEVGAAHGVHRATAARWLEQAREAVSRNVRRDLMKQLGVDPFETDDLLRWVQSRIDVSLSPLANPSKKSCD
jgi:RNA polymerase sigma-70 factor, ECF subfamily